jgi:hypothetical protein
MTSIIPRTTLTYTKPDLAEFFHYPDVSRDSLPYILGKPAVQAFALLRRTSWLCCWESSSDTILPSMLSAFDVFAIIATEILTNSMTVKQLGETVGTLEEALITLISSGENAVLVHLFCDADNYHHRLMMCSRLEAVISAGVSTKSAPLFSQQIMIQATAAMKRFKEEIAGVMKSSPSSVVHIVNY